MLRPLEGRKLGIAVNDLSVVGVIKPEAWSYGWKVGDRVLTINGKSVTTQDEFSRELAKAMDEYFSHMTPLTFEVYRDVGGILGRDSSESPPPRERALMREVEHACGNEGVCCGIEGVHVTPAKPPSPSIKVSEADMRRRRGCC